MGEERGEEQRVRRVKCIKSLELTSSALETGFGFSYTDINNQNIVISLRGRVLSRAVDRLAILLSRSQNQWLQPPVVEAVLYLL